MMIARSLTARGSRYFADRVTQIRLSGSGDVSLQELSHSNRSEEFHPRFEVEKREFRSRFELGDYLAGVTGEENIDRRDIIENSGLLNWLSAFYFDEICPPDPDGTREVRETARYVYDPSYKRYHRHVIFTSYELVALYGEYARIMLYSPLYSHNDFLEQIFARQEIVSIPSVVRVAYHLYWNEDTGRARKRATDRSEPGSLRRLIEVVYQLHLTYDLGVMNEEDLLNVLPAEFMRWMS